MAFALALSIFISANAVSSDHGPYLCRLFRDLLINKCKQLSAVSSFFPREACENQTKRNRELGPGITLIRIAFWGFLTIKIVFSLSFCFFDNLDNFLFSFALLFSVLQ